MVYLYDNPRYSKLLYGYRVDCRAYPECRVEGMVIGKEYDVKLEVPPVEGEEEVTYATSNPSICWVNGG